MSVSNTIKRQFVNAAGASIGSDEVVTAGGNPYVSEAIPANQTNLAVAFAFTNAKLKSFAAHSDQDCTIYTNEASSGAPQEKIVLKAGLTYEWSLTGSFLGEVADSAASPFDGDVTSLFVTNTTACTLTVSAIVDPT